MVGIDQVLSARRSVVKKMTPLDLQANLRRTKVSQKYISAGIAVHLLFQNLFYMHVAGKDVSTVCVHCCIIRMHRDSLLYSTSDLIGGS